MAISIIVIFIIGINLQSELALIEDRGEIRVQSTMPEGTSFEMMDRYIQQMTKVLQDSVKETEAIISVTAGGGGSNAANSGFVRLTLKDASLRKRTQQEFAEQITGITKKLNDARLFVIPVISSYFSEKTKSVSNVAIGKPEKHILHIEEK